jgi:hypothetical protein
VRSARRGLAAPLVRESSGHQQSIVLNTLNDVDDVSVLYDNSVAEVQSVFRYVFINPGLGGGC